MAESDETGAQPKGRTLQGIPQPRVQQVEKSRGPTAFRPTALPTDAGSAPALATDAGRQSARATEIEDQLPTLPGRESAQDVAVVPGQLLAERYRVIRRIGSGSMGHVWEAQHVVIGKAVALKVLASDTTAESVELAERFLREARAAARIHHPHVVDITDFGHTAAGVPYFVMELLRGQTLRALIESSAPLPWQTVRAVLMQITDALQHAHDAGVIHRDLKPDNIYLVEGEDPNVPTCKVIDFGIAKITQLGEEASAFTRTGMVYGTPAFMSPEQAEGEKIDPRTDIYALGCMTYEMLTGRRPFLGDAVELLFKHLFEEPPGMVSTGVAVEPEIEAIVRRCLRKNRALRFDSMTDVRDAVLGIGTGAPMVEVPDEPLRKPPKAMLTRFATTAPPFDPNLQTWTGESEVAKRSGLGPMIGIVAALAAAGTAAAYVGLDDDPPPREPAVPVAGPATPDSAPEQIVRPETPVSEPKADAPELSDEDVEPAEGDDPPAAELDDPFAPSVDESARPPASQRRRGKRPRPTASTPTPTPAADPAPVEDPAPEKDPPAPKQPRDLTDAKNPDLLAPFPD